MVREVFGKGMAILTALYPDYELKDETMGLYWEFLQHLSNVDFERAIKEHVSKKKWFPKVSELLEAVAPNRPTPIGVWNHLIYCAEADQKPEMDYATQRALEFIGGWEKFKLTPYDDLKFLFKNFKEAYLESVGLNDPGQGLIGGDPLPQLGGE